MRRSRVLALNILLFAGVLVLQEPVRRNALAILRLPFTVTAGTLRVLVSLPHLPSLRQENERLRSELIQRQLETAQLRESLRRAQEDQALRQAVPGPQGVTAAVIGRSLIPTQQTIWLDRGQRHGLTLESVIVDANGVIGRVVELHPATCVVLLLTDPESRIAGLVERSRETGLLVGRGRGLCELIYLDDTADIEAGDRVVTAGLGGPFPKGLLLGTVTRAFRNQATGVAWASVRPAARPGRLENVLCLSPSP